MCKKYLTIFMLAIIMVSLAGLQSCLKDSAEDERAEEQRLLKEYIARNNITVSPTSSGLYYIEVEPGTGSSPGWNDWVEISFTVRLLTTDEVVLTSDSAVAAENNIFNENFLYGPNRAKINTISITGLQEGLGLMKQGGRATLILPSSLAFGYFELENIPPFSTLIYDVELHYVIPNVFLFERERLNQYLTANSILTADSTASGLYYHEILAGTGDTHPGVGSVVEIIFKGSFLNGHIINETPSGETHTLMIGYNQAIAGIEEGLKLMKRGGKARLIIPYYLAYGAEGYIHQYYGYLIYPYTTLVYDIELVDFS